jgi:hypothetical protein
MNIEFLNFEPGLSRIKAAFILFNIFGAWVIVCSCGLPAPVKLIITGIMVIILGVELIKFKKGYRIVIRSFREVADGGWEVELSNTSRRLTKLHYPILVTNYLIIINFIELSNGKIWRCPIFKDALSLDDFRKLKKILIWRKC